MDPFVRRLVERLSHPSRPLSRNRHFHTFDTPEGRAALRIQRRLASLHQDLLGCLQDGGRAQARILEGRDGTRRMELSLTRLHARRTTLLPEAEWELLLQLPGVTEALSDG